MQRQDENRTETARRHDDSDLIEGQERAPSASGTSGGDIARTVGARDEETRATYPDAGITRVEGRDKEQPFIPTRADNDGANG